MFWSMTFMKSVGQTHTLVKKLCYCPPCHNLFLNPPHYIDKFDLRGRFCGMLRVKDCFSVCVLSFIGRQTHRWGLFMRTHLCYLPWYPESHTHSFSVGLHSPWSLQLEGHANMSQLFPVQRGSQVQLLYVGLHTPWLEQPLGHESTLWNKNNSHKYCKLHFMC